MLGVRDPLGQHGRAAQRRHPRTLRCHELRDRIRAPVRQNASPRHVPHEIIQVAGLPHTRTGKRLEVPLKRMKQGADPESVVQRTALDDPALLEPFLELARRRRAGGDD